MCIQHLSTTKVVSGPSITTPSPDIPTFPGSYLGSSKKSHHLKTTHINIKKEVEVVIAMQAPTFSNRHLFCLRNGVDKFCFKSSAATTTTTIT